MSDAIALISHANAAAPIAFDRGRTIAAGQFVADVHALSQRLPPGRFLLNGCSQRYWFAVTLGAAALAGRISLLPHTRTPGALGRVCEPYRNASTGGLGIVTDGTEILLDAPVAHAPREYARESHWPPPRIAAQATVAIAFTSGTTGAPQANPKTWGALVASARAQARALALENANTALLATVPPQHMYGFESSVLLALHNGNAFDVSQPLHPHEVAAALVRLPVPRMLVTTPTHLRALLRSDVDLHGTAMILCATSPLPQETAREAESRWSCEVHEIYGCTETGQVATRRTVASSWWKPLEGVRVTQRDDRFWASGEPVAREAPLADTLSIREDGDFRLIGRDTDLINVGGRRASLAGLSAILLEIDGVEDGVFFLPEPGEEGREARLLAFVVAPGAERNRIIAELRRRIDPLFLPRPLHLVDALPRNTLGKLALADLSALAHTLAARRDEADGSAGGDEHAARR